MPLRSEIGPIVLIAGLVILSEVADREANGYAVEESLPATAAHSSGNSNGSQAY